MSASAAPELDAHGFAMAKSTRYADSHEQALAQCVEDVMGQLQRKGCADAHNIVSVLWVSENNQVPHTSLAGSVRRAPWLASSACVSVREAWRESARRELTRMKHPRNTRASVLFGFHDPHKTRCP